MKKMIIGFLLFMVLIFGVDWIQRSMAPKQTQVYSLSDYSYTELEKGIIYKVENLTVVDRFAQKNQTANGVTTSTTDYYLVTFRDEDDRLVAATLSVDDDDEIFSQLSYCESLGIGNCTVNGYVKARENSSSELTQYFENAIDDYGPVFNEYLVSPQCMLVYHCNPLEDPLK